ncbi:hypothetical protein [Muricoccus vinaceus]|uniref:EcsC protein family protein n=1 Tax=Muricoccus vinaceus TaxID=424704 RepID=A0ABV6IU23_9PROT
MVVLIGEWPVEAVKEYDGGLLLKTLQTVAISPQNAMKAVAKYKKAAQKVNPQLSGAEIEKIVARKIIHRYARYASMSGGVTALPGVMPGVGTLVGMLGGGATDLTICMKLQVDMTMMLAANYGWDLDDQDALHMTLLIAVMGGLEKLGVGGGAPLASKAGVKMLNMYLKGAALQTVKQFLKKFGVNFTRKAAEKAIPGGVGVALSAGMNYGMTKYVGHQAVRCFTIERVLRSNPDIHESDLPPGLDDEP